MESDSSCLIDSKDTRGVTEVQPSLAGGWWGWQPFCWLWFGLVAPKLEVWLNLWLLISLATFQKRLRSCPGTFQKVQCLVGWLSGFTAKDDDSRREDSSKHVLHWRCSALSALMSLDGWTCGSFIMDDTHKSQLGGNDVRMEAEYISTVGQLH
jgi:hypothetical protein